MYKSLQFHGIWVDLGIDMGLATVFQKTPPPGGSPARGAPQTGYLGSKWPPSRGVGGQNPGVTPGNGPKRAKMGPKWAKMGPKWAKIGQNRPKWAKMAQNPPNIR